MKKLGLGGGAKCNKFSKFWWISYSFIIVILQLKFHANISLVTSVLKHILYFLYFVMDINLVQIYSIHTKFSSFVKFLKLIN